MAPVSPVSPVSPVTPVDTGAVRAAVNALPGVDRVHGRGPNGVSADADELEVHVVARHGAVLPDLAAALERDLAPWLGGRTLRVVVDDVAAGATPAGDTPAGAHPDDDTSDDGSRGDEGTGPRADA